MATLRIIQSKRRVEKASITRALTFVENPPEGINLAQIEARIDRLDTAYSDLKSLTAELYNFEDEEGFVDPDEEFAQYEEKYIFVKGVLKEMLGSVRQGEPAQQQDAFNRLAEQHSSLLNRLETPLNARSIENDLPKIRIEPFTGKYKDWPAFKDIFTSAIDSKPNLSNIQKFHYLKSVLKDDAANLIKHMQISDSSYATAWERLQERYNRPRHIVNSYIETFMSISSLKDENSSGLRKISDISNEVVRGLEAIGYDERDHWLIYILQTKIDADSRRKWIEQTRDEAKPTITTFLTFLDRRCEEIELGRNADKKTVIKYNNSKHVGPAAMVTTTEDKRCADCRSGEHFIHKCPHFLSLSIEKRRKLVKDRQLCYNCLREGHTVYSCKSKNKCRSCQHQHNSLLHVVKSKDVSHNNTSSSSSEVEQQVSLNTIVSQPSVKNLGSIVLTRILPTALVNVRNHEGNFETCRVLLDTASEYSYISESCIKRLGLSRVQSRMALSGIQSIKADPTRGHAFIQIRSRVSQDSLDTSVHVLGNITSALPRHSISKIDATLFENLSLADPYWYRSSPIDILLGADEVWNILLSEKLRNSCGKVIAVSTIFGWVVTSGFLSHQDHIPATLHTLVDLDQSIRAFWEIEESYNNVTKENDDSLIVEQHFKNTHARHTDGRYIVQLPFKIQEVKFSGTYEGAISRFRATERRLSMDANLRSQYIKFMQEYEALGHMRELSASEIDVCNNRVYYLPHHPVFGVKLRVVFDGSFKDLYGISLNEQLYIGPSIQRNLFAVCLQFRLNEYVFSADIIKMFRQIWVAEDHRNFQRIIWRENPNEPLKHFQLCTVTYGTASAPYLSVRVLQQLAEDYKESHPNASKILLDDFYVDDVLTGASSEQQLIENRDELVNLLAQAGLELSKWVSNSDKLSPTDQNTPSFLKGENNSTKVLGIHWYSKEDLIGFKICLDYSKQPTKRTILSDVARIFDPLGLVSPVVIKFKIMFQELWLMNIKWDDPLPTQFENLWLKFKHDLESLEKLRLPRFVPNGKVEIELHGFSDASTKAYAAVIYCLTREESGRVNVSLIVSKTRVSPLKQISLPRLELCGALLLTRLLKSVTSALPHKNVKIRAWCDSTVVLSWLSVQPIKLKTFVGNRTAEILETLPRDRWGHVGTKENPADCASRGLMVDQLLANDLWWSGPSF